MICVFSIFSTILNIEGSNCLSKINSIANEQNSNRTGGIQQQQALLQQLQQKEKQNQSEKEIKESFELLRYCFLITNLYVYSLFGIITGVIIIIIWYFKYKKIWSNTIKKIDK